MTANRVTIVGCGRSDCGDDAAGIRIGAALRRSALAGRPESRIVLTESPGVDLIADMEDAELFVVIDAARATGDRPPGTWERLDYRSFSGSLRAGRHHGTHGLSVAEALELADKLGQLPPEVWIYAVFGDRFDLGIEPSPKITAAIADVAAAIERDVACFLDRAPCTS